MGLFEKLREYGNKKFEERLRKAADKKSPVLIEVYAESRDRFAISVNQALVSVEVKQFIAFRRAREIKARLKAWGYDVLY